MTTVPSRGAILGFYVRGGGTNALQLGRFASDMAMHLRFTLAVKAHNTRV